MELKSNDLRLLEDSLNAKIALHELEIDEIKAIEDSYYESKAERLSGITKLTKGTPVTGEELRKKDIQKEIDKIKETKELRDKLFLSDSYLLLISNKVNLTLSK